MHRAAVRRGPPGPTARAARRRAVADRENRESLGFDNRCASLTSSSLKPSRVFPASIAPRRLLLGAGLIPRPDGGFSVARLPWMSTALDQRVFTAGVPGPALLSLDRDIFSSPLFA